MTEVKPRVSILNNQLYYLIHFSSKKDESNKSDDAAFLRPQRKGFPTGGWVKRGRRYAAEGAFVWLTRNSLL